MAEIWLEAESCYDLGGWCVDTQSMEMLRSSYIMAHGMGIPVPDAKAHIDVSESGLYHVWALTRDWSAVWKGADSIGKWQFAVDGTALEGILGIGNTEWGWQKCGTVRLDAGKHDCAFCDLTGFNGRCDAILFTTQAERPSDNTDDIEAKRRSLNYKTVADDETEYDLIVAGGGVSGVCLALSAIRMGVKTLLIHDRSVLGGCNSSEVRVCMGGITNLPPYDKIGDVVKEIAPVMGSPEHFDARYYEDDRKKFAFEASNSQRSVVYNQAVTELEKNGNTICSVVTVDTLTGAKKRYHGKLFADTTGDAVLSRLAGAKTMYGRESRDSFKESLAPVERDNLVMGHSIRWYSERSEHEEPFAQIDLGLELNENTYLDVFSGDWEQECGFRRNMVSEIEYIRDFGLRAIYSNWAYQKKYHADKYGNYRLKWVSPFGGKRESYRVVGDHILTQNDIESHIEYEDATSPMTWSIDLHFPECDNDRDFDEPFRSFAYHRGIERAYHVPYRCLYSKDTDNLFLGGRLVSATHVAFSSIRVMRTLGQLGEVVGIAASVCKKHDCLPRDVYRKYLDEFKHLLCEGVPIPSAFACSIASEEAYHFKDIGWLNLNPYSCDERHIGKFKRGIRYLNIKHKYELPDILK